jgi:spermidine synthase
LKRRDDGGVCAVVVATGIASVAVQLVCVREYLAQFQGNEIVIALIFFCWLVFGGVGTAAAKGIRTWVPPPSPTILAVLCCLLAIFSVGQVIAIRWLRDLFFIHGASVGFYPTLGYIAVTLLPYALLVGFLLPYSLSVARYRSARYPGNWIYMADNAGDVAGAAIFSFALVHWLTPFQVLLAVHLPLLAALFRLDSAFSRRSAAAGALAVAALLAGTVFENRLLPTREGRRIHYAESRYGRVEVVESAGETTIFSDGVPYLFSQNPALAEEIVHFPLSQVDHPRRLLLVSAVGGMMAQVAKYHPDRVDYVELDPLAAELQLRFGLLQPIHGLTVIAQDARAYLSQTSTRYDGILVSLPEPETFQVNRFYTAGFFKLAKNHLSPGGVFSFGIDGVANYISATRQQKLSVLANTAGNVFDHVMILPGQRLIFVCSDRPIRTDIPLLLERKGIDTRYVRRYYAGDLTDQRIRQLNDAVDADIGKNLDLSPRLMRLAFVGWFKRHGESPRWFVLALSAGALAYMIRLSRAQWVLLTTGCVNIGAEMVTIFAFQAIYGYIYLQIGVLVTVFLAGLLPGAWVGGRFTGNPRRALMIGDFLLCMLLAVFAVIMVAGRQGLPATILYGFGLAFSFCCGLQFPLALTLSGDSATAAAQSFSADLVGASIGVLLVSLVLVPYVGLLWATLCLAGIKLISLLAAGSIHETS